jgi:hypothetical protein
MADDKRTGKQDRERISAGDHYEVRDFAVEFDLSIGEARDLIGRHGNDREALERGARKLKK